jgi:alpha-tubulin suppressor-like RCC1 family protein
MPSYQVLLAGLLGVLALQAASPAQDQVRTWGYYANDSELFTAPLRKVSVSNGANGWILGLTRDGRIVGCGGDAPPPPPPAGLVYVDVFASDRPFGLLSDGTLVPFQSFSIGSTPPTSAPALPPGLRWLDLESTHHRAFAIRSDRTLHSWGTNFAGIELVPALAPGRHFVSLAASVRWMAALVSDGTIVTWGTHPSILQVQPVPPLPPGITYTAVEAGLNHLLALRSDGQAIAWGDNYWGQLNVPPLPQGMTYVTISTGGNHSAALRSDGRWFVWGSNFHGQISVPPHPPGTYASILASASSTIAIRPDGSMESWGLVEWTRPHSSGMRAESFDVIGAAAGCLVRDNPSSRPSLATYFAQASAGSTWMSSLDPGPGRHLTSIKFSGVHLGLVDDGTLRAYSHSNSSGQLNIPTLPAGLTYTAIAAGQASGFAIRSDGSAVGWGWNSGGQLNVPALPPGLRYTAVSADASNVLFLRSDGTIAIAGTGASYGLANLPSLPSGLRYIAVACGQSVAAALRSDGSIVSWGSTAAVPALPPGVSYVEVECGSNHIIARRSDGTAVTWGSTQPARISAAPILPPGRSYLRVAAGYPNCSAALIGSESRYVGFATGCPGSLPPSRIVPGDTPQIGKTFPALLTNLPTNLALLGFGWQQQLPPTPLATLGMPGCSAHIVADAIVPISGTGHEAPFSLPIPFMPGLLGIKFYNQAIVLDPAANNPLGAVVGEAMEGVLGG